MGSSFGVFSRPLHLAPFRVSCCNIVRFIHYITVTKNHTHSLQTLAMSALSIHASLHIREPVKRQQMGHILAALNIGSKLSFC